MTPDFIALVTFLGTAWFLPIIVALAIFSITRIITEDTLFDNQRNWFWDRFPYEGYQSAHKPKRGSAMQISGGKWHVTKGTKLGKLISCPWCSGFYVALVVFGFLLLSPIITTFVLFPFGLRVIPGLLSQ